MDIIQEVLGKINGVIALLPFAKLLGKIAALNRVARFANHAAIVLALVLLVACFGGGGGSSGNSSGNSGTASAKVVNGGKQYVIPASDFEYELSADGKGIKILDYTGPGGNIILPTEIEGLPIVEISSPLSVEFNDVTAIEIPDHYLAMWENSKGGPYRTPGNVGALFGLNGNYFGDDPTPLEKITFPKGITCIPSGFCSNSPLLKFVTLPDTVKEIGNSAFEGCGFTAITIPEGVTIIGSSAFGGCKDLKSVTLPESIEGIHAAFTGCTNLEIVNLPSHKIRYDNYAFLGCTKLSLATQKAIRDSGYTGTFN